MEGRERTKKKKSEKSSMKSHKHTKKSSLRHEVAVFAPRAPRRVLADRQHIVFLGVRLCCPRCFWIQAIP